MARPSIITGLDIGTGFLKILIAKKTNKDLEVLVQIKTPSFGLRKGVVINADATTKNIQNLLTELKKTYDKKIKSVFTNIGGSHLYVTPSHGLISVSRADQKISQEDVERVLQATQAINLPSNQEILDVFPTEFIIDDQKGVDEPIGLTGRRLEAKVLLFCSSSPCLKNLTQAVLEAGLQVDDVIPSPLAASKAVLSERQKELGVALVDIGAATTSLAVFEEGDLIHSAIFPIGSAHITNDIAIGLRTEIDIAEKIKLEFGSCYFGEGKKEKKSQGRKKIKIFEKSLPLVFSQKMLTGIIEARVSEIFNLIQKELKKISRQELLPSGVVLTGGGAKLPKITEMAKRTLKLPCKIGTIQKIIGLEDDPSLATAVGLVLEGAELQEEQSIFGFIKGAGSWLKKFLRIFIP